MARAAKDTTEKKTAKTKKAKTGKGPSAPAPNALKVSKETFQGVLANATKAKQKASEATGDLGQIVKDAVETHGINKHAFGFIRKLDAMEEAKRHAVLADFEQMCILAGFFDQAQLFGDLIRFKGEAIAALKSGGAKPPKGVKAEPAAAPGVLDLGRHREARKSGKAPAAETAAADKSSAEFGGPDPFAPITVLKKEEEPLAG